MSCCQQQLVKCGDNLKETYSMVNMEMNSHFWNQYITYAFPLDEQALPLP